MQNKLHNIQALRAFAVLLVVGLHLTAVEIKYGQYDALLPSFLRIGISGVDLFFVISGFIMVTVTANTHAGSFTERILASWRFFYLRLSRIYPLYWLVSTLVLAIYLLHPTFLNVPHFSLSFLVHSFLLLPQVGLPLVMVGWSLVYEMYFYVVFAFFLFLPRKYLPFLLVGWLLIVVVGFRHINPFDPDQNQYVRFALNPIAAEFILGCFLALYMFETRKNKESNYFFPLALPGLLTGFASLLILWHYFWFNTETVDVMGWTRVYLFAIPDALMLYGVVAMERNQQWTAPDWVVRIGDCSYSIYLTHILALSVCGRVWKTFAWPGYSDNVIILSLAMVSVLICGRLCYQWVEKPLLNLSRRLSV